MGHTLRALTALSALAVSIASPVLAADAALIEAAQKEGEVTWYTTAIVDQFVRPAVAAFEKKYGIKVNYWRASVSDMSLRVVNEARSGHMQADLVDGTTTPAVLRPQGLIEKWTPTVNLPARYVDPEGYWVAMNEYVLTAARNTDLVPDGTEPHSWEDFLAPQYKDKMVWNATPASSAGQGFVGLVMMEYGEEKARAYFAKLAKQNVASMKSAARQVLDQAIAGEYSLALEIFNTHATISKARGAPVDWLKIEPALAVIAPMSVTKGAPHPNAGKLLFDFVTSDEGQAIMAQSGELPISPRIKPLVPDLRPADGHYRATYVTPDQLQAGLPKWTQVFDEYFR